ncbi:hypothetical protein QBC35DRAFT_552767 [Podospora australis]|uniref:Uncharacterized protein n=1 Tax=Podospora australis TaxID=1536484 RepID=A0AAN6X302_9PEZI|nr:hypothetical protein QBC35DRAFT_552767 [Podospora australis]
MGQSAKARRLSASNIPTSKPVVKRKLLNSSTGALVEPRTVKMFEDENHPASAPSKRDDRTGAHIKREPSSESMAPCPEFGRIGRRSDNEASNNTSTQHPRSHSHHGSSSLREAFHKFRQRLRRSKSISLPADLEAAEALYQDGKKRRLLNRDRLEDPAPSSPLFRPWLCRLPNPDLIAIAGMMIAAGELDRLSLLADDVAKARAAGGGGNTPGSTGLLSPEVGPPNTPFARSGISSPLLSPLRPGDFVPFPPSNTPVYGTSEPASPARAAGRRAGPSRLAKVHIMGSNSETGHAGLQLVSLPEFPDINEETYTSRATTPQHTAAGHYFSEPDLNSGTVKEVKLKGHDEGEVETDRPAAHAAVEEGGPPTGLDGTEMYAIDGCSGTWPLDDGEPRDSEVICPRLSMRERDAYTAENAKGSEARDDKGSD